MRLTAIVCAVAVLVAACGGGNTATDAPASSSAEPNAEVQTTTASPLPTTASPPSTSPPLTTSPPSTAAPPPSTAAPIEFDFNLDTQPADIYFQQEWCDDIAARYPNSAFTPTELWCGFWQDYSAGMIGCFRGNEGPEGSDPEFEELVASGDLRGGARALDEIIFSTDDDDDDSFNSQINDACYEEHFPAGIGSLMFISADGRLGSSHWSFWSEMSLLAACAINTQLPDDSSVTQPLARECGTPVSQEASCANIAGAWIGAGGEGDMYPVCLGMDDLISSDMEGWLAETVRLILQSRISPEVAV